MEVALCHVVVIEVLAGRLSSLGVLGAAVALAEEGASAVAAEDLEASAEAVEVEAAPAAVGNLLNCVD